MPNGDKVTIFGLGALLKGSSGAWSAIVKTLANAPMAKVIVVLVVIQLLLTIASAVLELIVANESEQAIISAYEQAKKIDIAPEYAYELTHEDLEGYNEFRLHFIKAVEGPSVMPLYTASLLGPINSKLKAIFFQPPSFAIVARTNPFGISEESDTLNQTETGTSNY